MPNLPVLYGQRQTPWNTQRLGTVSGTTIGGEGCYVTCEAMKAQYYGHDVNPGQLDDLFTNKKIYVSGNLLPDNGLSQIFPDLTYVKTYDYKNSPADIALLAHLLTDPTVTVTIEVDFDHDPNDGIQTHFLEVVSCDNGNITIADPWYGSVDWFATHYGSKPQQTILKYVVYTGTPKGGTMTGSTLPANYPDIVHGSTQWDSTVTAYLPGGTLPKDASFEDLQKVVAGYKSQATASQNQLNQIQTDLSVAKQEIANRVEQVSRLTQQLADEDTTWKVRYDALNKTVDSADVLTLQYEGTINGLKTTLDQAMKDKGKALLDLSAAESSLTQCQSAQNAKIDLTSFTIADLLIAVLTKIKGG